MNIAVGFACLVAMAITAGVTGLPEQQLAVDEQLDDYDDDLLERKGPGGCGTQMFCGIAGGRCQPKDDECDGELRTNKFYCKGGKKCGCCIPRGPPGCVYDDVAYPNGYTFMIGCFKLYCNKGHLEVDANECELYVDCSSENTTSACPPPAQPCPCHRILNKGCIMTASNIPYLACNCKLTGSVGSKGSYCTGTVVNCVDPPSPYCIIPGKGRFNCMQGGGNCNGY